jgi:DNA-binding NtrC family response regulator
MEGIELLTKIKATTPKMRKIIVTGFPTMQNAVDAVNKGADAYVLKPFNVEKVLKIIDEQLKRQSEEKTYDQSKVAEFIETRVREIELAKTTVRKKKTF